MVSNIPALTPGTRVRLTGDPGRVGVVTGQQRSRLTAPLIQVVFPNATSWVPLDQVEILPEGPEHPLDLLRASKLGMMRDLRRAMTHVRLTGRLADVIYSMEATNTEFHAYQFKPVLKLLNAPTQGVLIADEVGLGKTIEAGLIWTELRSRFDYRRLFVLCPAFLRFKWKAELVNRFGVNATIINASGALDVLRRGATEGDEAEFALIGSIQGLRPMGDWREEEEQKTNAAGELARFLLRHGYEGPLIDLLIVDEAHYLRNPETKAADLGRLMRGVAQHIVLLSATPIHLRNADLFQLLNLIDEDTFQHPSIFQEILEANQPLVQARDLVLSRRATPETLQALLRTAGQHRLLENNEQLKRLLENPATVDDLRKEETIARLGHRLETVNLTAHSINRTRRRDVKEWKVIREPIDEPILMTQVERRFYEAVTERVRVACARLDYGEGLILTTPQRQMSSSMPAALRYWLGRRATEVEREEVFEDFGEDNYADDLGPIVGDLIRSARDLGSLDELYDNDSKYSRLRTLVTSFFAEQPGEKVVLFSYFRATLAYLADRLRKDDVPCLLLVGGTDGKEQTIEQFRRFKGSTVLLSSEVGSEGIDLEFCRVLVNYDLPWNPMRIEQRIGRLDRLGQKAAKISIWNLFYDDTIDARIYNRLYTRLRIFESALGELEPILGKAIQRLTSDLLREHLTPEQEDQRIQQTAVAVEMKRHEEEKLENEAAHLVAYGDYILREIHAARSLNRMIRGEDLRSYVVDFLRLNYSGCHCLQSPDDPLLFDISLSIEAKVDLEDFVRTHRLFGLTRLTLNHPAPICCRFENSVIHVRRSRIEIVSQFHPLVRFITSRLSAESALLYPAVAVLLGTSEDLAAVVAPGTYVFTVQRWSISGLRDIDKLAYGVAPLGDSRQVLSAAEAERLVMAAVNYGRDWPEAPSEVDLAAVYRIADTLLIHRSDREFAAFCEDVAVQNRDRATLQRKSLENHRDTQIAKLMDIRDKHRHVNREGLARATEGRIAALSNRMERELLRVARRQELNSHKNEVCLGLIKLNGKAE